ncbi:MAG: hypothetical protein AB7T49_04470 [Oligoflexales bacterium]
MILRTILEMMDLECVFSAVVTNFFHSDDQSGSLAKNGQVTTINDQILIRHLLPDEVFKYARSKGIVGDFALSFALRHRICYLNFLLNLQTLARRKGSMDYRHVEASFNEDIGSDRLTLKEWMAKSPLQQAIDAGRLPIFGFSALGIHCVTRDSQLCRAFDVQDVPHCESSCDGVFCETHSHEAWWLSKDEVKNTAQAKMHSFYSRQNNFYTYDAKALKDLVESFWLKYCQWQHCFDQEAVEKSLALFSLASEHDLYLLGPEGLREKFLSLALQRHPDQGGTNTAFLELKQSYDLLKKKVLFKQAG